MLLNSRQPVLPHLSFDGIGQMKSGKFSTDHLLNYRYDNSLRLAKTKATIGTQDDFENVYSYNTFGELVEILQTSIKIYLRHKP
ncbi:MAG: hypothetical protein LBP59_14715 [Planctomycetaceae bacterium]|jgi:hypothetical protein|nr:hypothetical protein [Planctomycetaceae bacterium]